MALNRLYAPAAVSLEQNLTDDEFFNSLSDAIQKAFNKAARHIHRQHGYKPEMLTDAPVADLIGATASAYQEPLRQIGVQREIPAELTAALEQNTFVFSGFKTHHELTEASRLLRDADGGFKPFNQFLNDVQTLNETYNRNYLRAEYNFATASTSMAVKWKEWEADGDDYDLQYRTAGDDRVREEHAALDGITLPPSDKFWNSYLPPNGWNCRCTAVQVLKDKYPESDSDKACAAADGIADTPKKQIFKFNPGKQMKVFPPKHPYLPKGCGDCGRTLLSYNPNSEQCRACKSVNAAMSQNKPTKPTLKEKQQIRAAYESFVQTLPAVKIDGDISHRKDITTANGETIRVGKKFFSETFAKNSRNPKLKETMDLAMDFEKWMPTLSQGQVENGIDHSFQFKAYKFRYQDYDIVFKAKLTEGIIAYTMRIK